MKNMCVDIPLTTYGTFSGNCNVWPFVHILLMFNFNKSDRTTCPKKLVMPVGVANRLHRTNVFTRFLSGIQGGLTGQGGNIRNKQTCLSIGPTQLYVYCGTVYQIRAVQACAVIGALLPVTLVDLRFCQHHTVSAVVDIQLQRVSGECVVL
jgi:hypothetical protein